MNPITINVKYTPADDNSEVKVHICNILKSDILIENTLGADITNDFNVKEIAPGTFTIGLKPKTKNHENKND